LFAAKPRGCGQCMYAFMKKNVDEAALANLKKQATGVLLLK
jgi:hypothetical protein